MAGFLNLYQPWSHMSLDLVTGLPSSEGNTVILTVVDCLCLQVHRKHQKSCITCARRSCVTRDHYQDDVICTWNCCWKVTKRKHHVNVAIELKKPYG